MSVWSVGFDIGGTSARVALYGTPHSSPLHTLKRTLRQDTSPDGVLGLMREMYDELLGLAALNNSHIHGIGAGIAAQMNRAHTIALNAPNLGWRDVPIADLAQAHFGRPLVFCNDLNALALGESMGGAAQPYQDVLTVCVGTGVGAALMYNGELMTGADGLAAELGHVKVQVGGKLCGCGERGCLEAYAGGVHLERAVMGLIHTTSPGWASQVVREQGAVSVDLGAADALCAQDDALKAIFDVAADYLCLAIANACTLLNPEVVVLGGGVLKHCPNMYHRVLQGIIPLVLGASRQRLRVAECALGEDAAMLGAAALATRVLANSGLHG